MQTIAERLEQALKESGMSASELARAIRIRPQAVSQWISGATKSPSAKNLLRAAEAMGVDPGWLIEGKGSRAAVTARIVEPLALPDAARIDAYHPEEDLLPGEVAIPALNVRVGAGNRIVTEPVKEERRFRYSIDWLHKYGLDASKLIRFRVQGQSMEPVIMSGAWITVDMSNTAVVDGFPYLIRSGDQIAVKYLFKRPDQGLIIRSHNPSEPDVVVPIGEMENVSVLGRVVESSTMWVRPVKP